MVPLRRHLLLRGAMPSTKGFCSTGSRAMLPTSCFRAAHPRPFRSEQYEAIFPVVRAYNRLFLPYWQIWSHENVRAVRRETVDETRRAAAQDPGAREPAQGDGRRPVGEPQISRDRVRRDLSLLSDECRLRKIHHGAKAAQAATQSAQECPWL